MNNKKWDEEREIERDTMPNYMALFYAIKHNKTTDEALRDLEVYDRMRSPHINIINDNSYVTRMEEEEEKPKITRKKRNKKVTK